MPNPCDAVLVHNVSVSEQSLKARLAIAQLMTKESFDDATHKLSLGISVPIGDLVIGAHGDYSDFKQRRDSFLQQNSYASDDAQARRDIRDFVPTEAITAWQACMDSQVGFRLWAEHADGDSVTVKFRWRPPAGVGDTKVQDSTLLGAKSPPGTPSGKALKNGLAFVPQGEKTMVYQRNPDQDFSIAVNVENYSDSLDLPAFDLQYDAVIARLSKLESAIQKKQLPGQIILSGWAKDGEKVLLPDGENTKKFDWIVSMDYTGIPLDNAYADNGFSGFQCAFSEMPDERGWNMVARSAHTNAGGMTAIQVHASTARYVIFRV
jgi:hypothetical protein